MLQDFYWESTDEPHATRRKEILAKYPQIKNLMGYDWRICVQIVIMVFAQLFMTFMVRNMSWIEIFVLSYVVGGTLNHSLSLGLHEISHNLAFGNHRPLQNRLIGFFANLPIGFAASITFKKYHLDHHKYQGDALMDVDLPTRLEAKLFSTRIGKFLFVILQPLFYTLRPVLVLPKKITLLEIINWAIQIAFNIAVYYMFGIKSLCYLWLGTLLGLG